MILLISLAEFSNLSLRASSILNDQRRVYTSLEHFSRSKAWRNRLQTCATFFTWFSVNCRHLLDCSQKSSSIKSELKFPESSLSRIRMRTCSIHFSASGLDSLVDASCSESARVTITSVIVISASLESDLSDLSMWYLWPRVRKELKKWEFMYWMTIRSLRIVASDCSEKVESMLWVK